MSKFTYVKRPLEIEAVRYKGDGKVYGEDIPDWMMDALNTKIIEADSDGNLYIKTLEGKMLVTKDNWIIRGIKGELYPCKHNIFEELHFKKDKSND